MDAQIHFRFASESNSNMGVNSSTWGEYGRQADQTPGPSGAALTLTSGPTSGSATRVASPQLSRSAGCKSASFLCSNHRGELAFSQILSAYRYAVFFARALTRARFDRSSRSLSAWRMHGNNLSRSKAAGIESERIRIEATFAPKSRARRTAYRHALKIWLNATSPRWLLHKKLALLRPADRDN